MPLKQLYWAFPGHDTGLERPFMELFDGVVVLNEETVENITKHDVMMFDGGTDINPEIYGEDPHPLTQTPDKLRDERERVWFRRAQAAGAACLGICRGAQLLCALSGGKLIQHVTGHEGPNAHVVVAEDGREFIASGDHHQMMYPYTAPDWELLAWAEKLSQSHCMYGKIIEDGKEPEVVLFPHTNSLCIQAHPEWMQYSMSFPMYCRELVTTLFLYRR